MLDDLKDQREYSRVLLGVYGLICIIIVAYWYGRWYNNDSFKEPPEPMAQDSVHIQSDEPKDSRYVQKTYIYFSGDLPVRGPAPIGEGPRQGVVFRDPPPLIRTL